MRSTVSLSGRPLHLQTRREHTILVCARGAESLTLHGRSKRGLDNGRSTLCADSGGGSAKRLATSPACGAAIRQSVMPECFRIPEVRARKREMQRADGGSV